jgi:hypothetical protein
MADMQHMAGPAAQQQQQPGATPPDLGKLFASEREALELVEHRWLLEDAEQKAIMRLSALMQQANGNQEKLKSA